MDPAFVEYVLDYSKCKKLSVEEKRAFLYEVSNWSDRAPQLLQTWSRHELLHILAVELGKERKLTSWSKSKIIELLLKTVAEKIRAKAIGADIELQPEKADNANTSKKQRKAENPSRHQMSTGHVSSSASKGDIDNKICQNTACRAIRDQEDDFCKWCSCCICFQFDEIKDPSLWFCCSSLLPFQGDSCGMSCHIECALNHTRAGISKYAFRETQDGGFYCVYCGKENDLLRCYRKLLVRAKESKSIEMFCSHLSLTQKLLKGTQKYHKLREIVDAVVDKLEVERGLVVSPLAKTANRVICKLSSAEEIEKLCTSALESLDSFLSCTTLLPQCLDNMPGNPSAGDESNNLSYQEQIKSQQGNYVVKPEIPDSEKLSDGASKNLSADAEHRETPEHSVCAVNDECLMGEVGSLPISAIYPESQKNFPTTGDNLVFPKPEKKSPEGQLPTVLSTNNGSSTPVGKWLDTVSCEHDSDGELPSTRRKLVFGADDTGRSLKPESAGMSNDKISGESEKEPRDGSFLKKRKVGSNEECGTCEFMVKEFEDSVKKIRWLECEGYIETNFRLKFLTWFSMKATPEETWVVKVYLRTLADDPVSLSRQLVHSFSAKIFNKTT